MYRAGRALGIEMLGLMPGAQILDMGCGTGLNFSLLQQKIQPRGTIVGIDRSAEMLGQARRRAQRNGWTNIILLQADAVHLSPDVLGSDITAAGGSILSQAALSTYALSLMPDWRLAWKNMTALTEAEGRAAIVDMQDPTGLASVWTPLTRLAARLGGSDISAHPWKAIEEDCTTVESAEARGGHLQIRAGTLPTKPATGEP